MKSGTAKLEDGRWHLDLLPHVAMQIKRMFRRIEERKTTLYIRSTPEFCRDLEWFSQRYPIDFGKSLPELIRLARMHDEKLERAAAILSPDYKAPGIEMKLPPRDYQAQAAELCALNGSLLLADQVGTGKTISAIALLAMTKAMPAVVVCPPHIQTQWVHQIWRFLRVQAHIAMKREPYLIRGRHPDVLILSYAKLSGWARFLAEKTKLVIFDEVHELRRRDSEKYNGASILVEHAKYRLGLSATPIYNYGNEFWSVIEILSPDSIGSRDEFIREWCVGDYQKERIVDPRAFGAYLRESGLMLRRTRREIGRELPPVSRIVQEVECSLDVLDSVKTEAAELARIIISQGGQHSGLEKMRAGGEFDMKMRQITGIAKAPFVAEFVRMLLETEDEPVVLFGWHRAVYDLWMDLLKEYNPVLYTGSETPAQKNISVQRFKTGQSRLLIMSLRSGAGVDGLQETCSRCVIGELDWSPSAITQCIGRLDREGQKSPVFAYYVVTDDGADPIMQDVLGIKSGQMEFVVDPDAEVAEPREADPEHIKKLAEAYLKK